MNVQEIRDKTSEELVKELDNLKDELFHLRFQHAINQLDNPMRLVSVRKDIARVKTILREKTSEENGAES